MWNKKPTKCHLVLYLFLLYKLLNMFQATLCPSSGAEVVFFHVWCSAVIMGSVISIYVQYLRVDIFICFHVLLGGLLWCGGFLCLVVSAVVYRCDLMCRLIKLQTRCCKFFVGVHQDIQTSMLQKGMTVLYFADRVIQTADVLLFSGP